jgi:phosphoheptose isomerase
MALTAEAFRIDRNPPTAKRRVQATERRALPAWLLTTDTSFLTAFGNGYGFEGIFEGQVEALGSPGDLLIGISTSGIHRTLDAVEV